MSSHGAEFGKRVRQDVVEAPERLRRLHHHEASHLFGAIARNDGAYKPVELNREADAEKPEPKYDANSTEIVQELG